MPHVSVIESISRNSFSILLNVQFSALSIIAAGMNYVKAHCSIYRLWYLVERLAITMHGSGISKGRYGSLPVFAPQNTKNIHCWVDIG